MNSTLTSTSTALNTLSKYMDLLNPRIKSWHAFLISSIIAICSIISHNGGIAHPEIQSYLPYYLSNRPLLYKIYDSKVLDMDMFQAREVSYLVDYIDCKFIELGVKLGHPHFLSITTYIFLLIIGMLIWHFSVHELKLPPIIGLALVSLYWTSPSIFFAGDYYRSSKSGTAIATALLFLLIYKYFQQTNSKQQHTKFLVIAIFLVSLLATLLDRQGFFMIGAAVLFILFWQVEFPGRQNFLPLVALGISLAFSMVYNVFLAPWLTYSLNHYQPNFSYQQIPWERFFRDPLSYIIEGTSLYIDTVRFALGNIPPEIVVIGLIFLIIAVSNKYLRERKQNGRAEKSTGTGIGLILTNVFLLIALNSLMILRHPPLVWNDVRRVYYWIPEIAMLFMAFALGLSALLNQTNIRSNLIMVLLFLAVIGNVYALPSHKSYLLNGHLKAYYESAPALLEGLKNITNEQYHPTPETLANPIYQWFADSSSK
jgi:hypothetical protein